MTLQKEIYYLSKLDLRKIENGESVDLITKDKRHIQILLDTENE